MQVLSIAARPFAVKLVLFAALLVAAMTLTTSLTLADAATDVDPTAAEGGTLEIFVYDGRADVPVAGARILVLDATGSHKVLTTRTDRRGMSSVYLPVGGYQLRIWARGYQALEVSEVSVRAAQTDGVRLALEPWTRDGQVE